MCSRSRLVTTARMGDNFRKERSLSSASATRYCDLPRRAFEPRVSTRPPTTTVGSRPPAASTVAIIDVVVVLPCMPATAIPYLRRMSSASISARWMTGIFRRRASITSGLRSFTAELVTTTPAPTTLAAAWPSKMVAPSDARRSVMGVWRRSEPLTVLLRLRRISAMPLIPMPPIPMKWTRCGFRNMMLIKSAYVTLTAPFGDADAIPLPCPSSCVRDDRCPAPWAACRAARSHRSGRARRRSIDHRTADVQGHSLRGASGGRFALARAEGCGWMDGCPRCDEIRGGMHAAGDAALRYSTLRDERRLSVSQRLDAVVHADRAGSRDGFRSWRVIYHRLGFATAIRWRQSGQSWSRGRHHKLPPWHPGLSRPS